MQVLRTRGVGFASSLVEDFITSSVSNPLQVCDDVHGQFYNIRMSKQFVEY